MFYLYWLPHGNKKLCFQRNGEKNHKWEIPKTRKVRRCLKETKHKHNDDNDGDKNDDDDNTGVPSFSQDMMGAGSPVAAHCNQIVKLTDIELNFKENFEL